MKDDNNFITSYKKLFQLIKNDRIKECPDADLLQQYFNNELSSTEKENLEIHLDLCPICFAAVEQTMRASIEGSTLPEDWGTIEKEIDRKFYNQFSKLYHLHGSNAAGIIQQIKGRLSWLLALKWFATKRWLYATGFAVIIIACLYGYAYFQRSDYFHFAQIELLDISPMRGFSEPKNDFAEGLSALRKGRYKKAVRYLAGYQKQHPDAFEANFYLGLSYLFDAKQKLLGYAYRFKHPRVDAGLHYLKRALIVAEDNMYYQEDCLLYLAKAHLMKGERNMAITYLNQILELPHPHLTRKAQVRQLLEKVQSSSTLSS